MTGSVALDVVIGLVFIYLLYSLFATVIMEIVNSFLGLRARNLRYTVRRMLMDEKVDFWLKIDPNESQFIQLLKQVVHFLQKPLLKVVNSLVKISGKSSNLTDPGLFHHFYEQPAIKYLSAGAISNKPSYISPKNFSKTLIDTLISKFNVEDILNKIEKDFDSTKLLNELEDTSELKHDFIQMDKEQKSFASQFVHKSNQEKLEIAAEILPSGVQLKQYLQVALDRSDNISESNSPSSSHDTDTTNQSLIEKIQAGISVLPEGSDTRTYLESLIRDSNKDVQKFKFLLEDWFNDTMERSAGWYKRRVQKFLLIIGFILAVSFNADTLDIVKKLSNDTEARAQLVELAIAYSQDNPALVEENKTVTDTSKSKRDSLMNAAELIRSDIYTAQNLISSNWKIPDSIDINKKIKAPNDFIKHTYYIEVRDSALVEKGKYKKITTNVKVSSLLHKSIDLKAFVNSVPVTSKAAYDKGRINVNQKAYKWRYVFSWQGWNFKYLWGYILTALAISLGSPFWFDLMNRLIRLRSSLKPEQEKKSSGNNTTNNDATLINRVG